MSGRSDVNSVSATRSKAACSGPAIRSGSTRNSSIPKPAAMSGPIASIVHYLELQDDITGRIARMLGLELVVLAARSIELEHQTNPTASDLALQGWAALYKPAAPETREEARRLFERALELDPHTLRAVTGLSLT